MSYFYAWFPPKIDMIIRKIEPILLRRVHICTRMRTRHVGRKRMPTNTKKLLVQHSLHKRTSKCFTGYSLAARMNVRPHQYDGERIFLWSTDSRWIAFAEHTPHKRMLFAYTSTLCVSRSRTDVNVNVHPSTTMTRTKTVSPFYLLSLSNMLDLIRQHVGPYSSH